MEFILMTNSGSRVEFIYEDSIVEALHKAWLNEVKLYKVEGSEKRLIFNPFENDDFNSGLLEYYGYKISRDGFYMLDILDLDSGDLFKFMKSELEFLY